jgi:hypothetical protein
MTDNDVWARKDDEMDEQVVIDNIYEMFPHALVSVDEDAYIVVHTYVQYSGKNGEYVSGKFRDMIGDRMLNRVLIAVMAMVVAIIAFGAGARMTDEPLSQCHEDEYWTTTHVEKIGDYTSSDLVCVHVDEIKEG